MGAKEVVENIEMEKRRSVEAASLLTGLPQPIQSGWWHLAFGRVELFLLFVLPRAYARGYHLPPFGRGFHRRICIVSHLEAGTSLRSLLNVAAPCFPRLQILEFLRPLFEPDEQWGSHRSGTAHKNQNESSTWLELDSGGVSCCTQFPPSSPPKDPRLQTQTSQAGAGMPRSG